MNQNQQLAVVAKSLGENANPARVRNFKWAVTQLRLGQCVARKSFALDVHPKRLFYIVEGNHEIEVLKLRTESEWQAFACFTWADINASDWYLCSQLEIVR